MNFLISSLSAFKDTDILLWFQNISHYNDGAEVVAVAARDIKEGEEVKSSSQTSRTNISAFQIYLDLPSQHLLTITTSTKSIAKRFATTTSPPPWSCPEGKEELGWRTTTGIIARWVKEKPQSLRNNDSMNFSQCCACTADTPPLVEMKKKGEPQPGKCPRSVETNNIVWTFKNCFKALLQPHRDIEEAEKKVEGLMSKATISPVFDPEEILDEAQVYIHTYLETPLI